MRIASIPPVGGPTDVAHWLNRPLTDIAAECDQIRAERGLPDFLLRCLLDDIATVTERTSDVSCNYRKTIGLGLHTNGCERCDRIRQINRDYKAKQKAVA